MSEIAFIDVDDDEDCVDSSSSVRATQQQQDLSDRGVFDYFSSPLTLACTSANLAQQLNCRSQNHYYLGPGGASSLRSSGVRRFVEAHRQAHTTTSSDEEFGGGSYESPSSHKDSVHESASLDSQWVREQYNHHIRQANTQSYDEVVLCDDYLAENRPFCAVDGSSMHASEHVLSQQTCSDMSRDVCDSFQRLKLTKDADSYRDVATLDSDATDAHCTADDTKNSSSVTQSFLLRLGPRGDTASHQNAVCRSSEMSTVVSTVGSVRCSTGVDTGVGFPLSTVSSWNSQGHVDGSRLSSSGQTTIST